MHDNLIIRRLLDAVDLKCELNYMFLMIFRMVLFLLGHGPHFEGAKVLTSTSCLLIDKQKV